MDNKMHLDIAGKSGRVLLAALPSPRAKLKPVLKTSAGTVQRARLLNGLTPSLDIGNLSADALVKGDPELDFAKVAVPLEDAMSAYYDPTAAVPLPVGHFTQTEIVTDAQGKEIKRRPFMPKSRNIDLTSPIRIARRLPLDKALPMFVFRHVHQLLHEDSLTFDFLFGLAKELHEKRELALLGAGAKGNEPLVIRERGTPYRAFLFGEVSPDQSSYRLLMLLSDQELKLPAPTPTEAVA
jgi:hypothetical protein